MQNRALWRDSPTISTFYVAFVETWGVAFLIPDTQLEQILRGMKILTENLMGVKTIKKKLRGAKFPTLFLRDVEYFDDDELWMRYVFSGDIS